MRAVQVITTTGPADLQVVDIPEPTPTEADVLIEVHAVGVSFPDLLLTKGEYQLRPDPPFTLGVDIAGVVLADAHGFRAGDRVAAVMGVGGSSEIAAVNHDGVFALPASMSFAEGAATPMNYLTAEFTLVERAHLKAGETVLIHGASGGVGTATIQVAQGLGATTIAVVSSQAKADFALAAGADHAVLLESFKDDAMALTEGRGVDVVVDVVGGATFTDSLRALASQGRLMVVGFASGDGIPEVKVNRLLLNNVDVRGAGWGAFAMMRPGYMKGQWERLIPLMESGAIKPPIGATYSLDQFGEALIDMDERRTLGKSVVLVRP